MKSYIAYTQHNIESITSLENISWLSCDNTSAPNDKPTAGAKLEPPRPASASLSLSLTPTLVTWPRNGIIHNYICTQSNNLSSTQLRRNIYSSQMYAKYIKAVIYACNTSGIGQKKKKKKKKKTKLYPYTKQSLIINTAI